MMWSWTNHGACRLSKGYEILPAEKIQTREKVIPVDKEKTFKSLMGALVALGDLYIGKDSLGRAYMYCFVFNPSREDRIILK